MLIRKVEKRIIQELMKGEKEFKPMAKRLQIDYSTLNSIVRRLLTYDLIFRNEDGTYGTSSCEMKVASDKEVKYYRRINANRLPAMDNPLPLVTGEELEDLKEFVRIHCEEEVPRSIILDRLKKHGYVLTRLELLQFVECFKLAPKRKKEKESALEAA